MKKLKAKLNAKKRKGFTIVELIVVMAIIAILTLIAVPTFTKFIDDAAETTTEANARTLYEVAMTEVVSTVTSPEDYATFADLSDEIATGANITGAVVTTTAYKIGTVPTDDATDGWNIYVPTTDGSETIANINTSEDIYIQSPIAEGGQFYVNGNAN